MLLALAAKFAASPEPGRAPKCQFDSPTAHAQTKHSAAAALGLSPSQLWPLVVPIYGLKHEGMCTELCYSFPSPTMHQPTCLCSLDTSPQTRCFSARNKAPQGPSGWAALQHWTEAGEKISPPDSALEKLLSSVHRRGLLEKEVLVLIVVFWCCVRWCPEVKGSCRICLLPRLDEARAH